MNEDKSGIERHTQTILSSVVLALLLWTGATLLDIQNRVVRIESYNVARAENLADVKAQLEEFRKRLSTIEIEHARVPAK